MCPGEEQEMGEWRREQNIRVGSGIGHGQEEGAVVAALEVLIGKLLTVDGLATGALLLVLALVYVSPETIQQSDLARWKIYVRCRE